MSFRIVNGVKIVCPFCGLEVQAGTMVHDDGSEHEGVLHMTPMCRTFEENDPDDFLYLARKAIERSAAAGTS